MELRFANSELERLDREPEFEAGLPKEVVGKYRMRMQLIRGAPDERKFYALKSLRYKKLKGKRSHQRSMRLNDQWRLVIEVEKGKKGNTVVIVSVEDYH